MSDETTQNTTPSLSPILELKLGGESIVSTTKSIKNSWQRCTNNNQVYIDSLFANNRDKTQFFINPNNNKILLGQTRIQNQGYNDGSGGTYYNVYLNTTTTPVTNSQTGGGTAGGTANLTIQGGYGINVKNISDDVVEISINTNVVPTKDEYGEGGTGNCILTNHEQSLLKYMLELLDVEYSSQDYNLLTLGEGGTSIKQFFAFSFQFNYNIDETINYNSIKLKNEVSSTDSPMYAVIRKCENIDDTYWNTLPTYVDNNDEAPTEQNNDKFEYLLNNSHIIAISNNFINQSQEENGKELYWYFPSQFNIQVGGIYLVTFHSDKTGQITSENTRLLKLKCNSDTQLSQYIRIFNKNFTEDQGTFVPNIDFCYKKPIGVILK